MLELVPQAPNTILSNEVASRLFGAEPTEAQRRSMRRAIRSLADKGLVNTQVKPSPAMFRDVVATAWPDGSHYRKVDRGGHRLGTARMNVLSRPADGPVTAREAQR